MSRSAAPPRPLDLVLVGALPPLPGGAAISISQLLIGLAGFGHRIRALAPLIAEAGHQEDSFAMRHPALGVTRFPVPYYELAAYAPPPDAYRALEAREIEPRLTRLVAESRPDALLIGRESYSWYVPTQAKRHGIPCVLLARGNPTRAILYGTYPAAPAAYFLEQFRKVDLIITVARYLEEGLRGLGLSRVTTIPNAIDLEQFAPRPADETRRRALGIQPEDVTVLHLSNLTALKRPMDIIDSAEHALRQQPHLLYLIAGEGEFRARMEEACRSKQIAHRFRFLGWLDYECVPAHINLADMVVMASEGEGLARVYLETQACARVLVASDIPAAREVVRDGVTGLLFRTGDVAHLAAQTVRAATQPKLREAIGQNSHLNAQAHGLPEAIRTYSAVLQRLVASQAPGSAAVS